jgi:hypothetical protein
VECSGRRSDAHAAALQHGQPLAHAGPADNCLYGAGLCEASGSLFLAEVRVWTNQIASTGTEAVLLETESDLKFAVYDVAVFDAGMPVQPLVWS